jgi:2-dehydropantoate 2-reductase
VQEVARQLHATLQPHTVVMPLQNGISAAAELVEVLGEQHVIGGLCRVISKIETPGIIRHSGLEPVIVFGELDNACSNRVLKIKAMLRRAGIMATIASNIQDELWKKFMAICVSGLLAVTRTPYGIMRSLPKTRRMMIDLIREIHACARSAGVELDECSIAKTIALIDSYPHDSTSSLTRDIWEGRPSEIDYQNGTVVKLAETYGLSVPVNTFIYSCLLPSELAAREKARRPDPFVRRDAQEPVERDATWSKKVDPLEIGAP